MRLLLDEHYSPTIAKQLSERGHDVVAVQERGDLRGLGDREFWARAVAQRRALMTENVADFMSLVHESAAAGEQHYGVVFTSPHSMPRGAGTIGLYVEALDRFLRERAAESDLADQTAWLH